MDSESRGASALRRPIVDPVRTFPHQGVELSAAVHACWIPEPRSCHDAVHYQVGRVDLRESQRGQSGRERSALNRFRVGASALVTGPERVRHVVLNCRHKGRQLPAAQDELSASGWCR